MASYYPGRVAESLEDKMHRGARELSNWIREPWTRAWMADALEEADKFFGPVPGTPWTGAPDESSGLIPLNDILGAIAQASERPPAAPHDALPYVRLDSASRPVFEGRMIACNDAHVIQNTANDIQTNVLWFRSPDGLVMQREDAVNPADLLKKLHTFEPKKRS
jgi:hypothetical protein